MTPALYQVLTQLKASIKRDLDVLDSLLSQKKEEFVRVSSMLYHISDNLEAMAQENTEKLVINCDPPDVDEEGALL